MTEDSFPSKTENAYPDEAAWVTVCAWCERYKNGDTWLPIEKPLTSLVTHGICPDCRVKSLEELEAL